MSTNEKILLARRKAGFTQKQVCTRLAITKQTLVDIERGRVQIDDDEADRFISTIRDLVTEKEKQKEGDK